MDFECQQSVHRIFERKKWEVDCKIYKNRMLVSVANVAFRSQVFFGQRIEETKMKLAFSLDFLDSRSATIQNASLVPP
jgi:hypothetical protein